MLEIVYSFLLKSTRRSILEPFPAIKINSDNFSRAEPNIGKIHDAIDPNRHLRVTFKQFWRELVDLV